MVGKTQEHVHPHFGEMLSLQSQENITFSIPEEDVKK